MINARLVVLLSACLSLCFVFPTVAGPDESEFGDLAEALGKKVTIDLIGTPLPRALETLARESGINILIAPQYAAGLSGESITLTIRDLPTSKAINLIGLATGTDWYIQDGVVLVASSSYVRSLNVEMRMFDIGALLESVPNFNGQYLSLDGTLSNTSSGGSTAGGGASYGSGGSLFGDDNESDTEEMPSRQELVDQINALIVSTTAQKCTTVVEVSVKPPSYAACDFSISNVTTPPITQRQPYILCEVIDPSPFITHQHRSGLGWTEDGRREKTGDGLGRGADGSGREKTEDGSREWRGRPPAW